ncbi:SDR family NAD(P)-dependent oxidoreductase [Emcibacter nanhaiensis]|uniref:SDR family oxidoreductase n=1 Tax=Emcibacter nanhaiensis TaxID=1505037 RepID=A0A501PGU1_9PROT|nr:SDR family oxidoreductase [Emcibacter nanhaiensis]TPD59211.1 SDR family oxidoreductase [Emcibacter nanhaiensis]
MTEQTQGKFKGKHAVITGGGRGIGAAIADALAAEGAKLTLLGRNEEVLKAKAETLPAALPLSCDVTDQAAVEAVIAQAREAHGPVDILVNNAGAAHPAPFMKTSSEQLQSMLDVNLMGPWYCIQAVLPEMQERDSGRIVNIASTAALIGYKYVTAYAAAKHAVQGMTRSLALELAGRNITINSVCPGFTETDIAFDAIENIMSKTGRSREEAIAELAKHNPQKRFIQPEEVASAVLWLCEDINRSMTGQAISVAGGEVM